MSSLQKFKLLATQCAVITSPTRSPTTSPVIHIRRRKSLRMLLRGGSHGSVFLRRFQTQPPRRHDLPDRPNNSDDNRSPRQTGTKQHLGVRLKLKDLFISSPPPANNTVGDGEESRRLLPDAGELAVARPVAGGGIRPLSATLRQRLLMRRAWRPVLVAIPEQSP